MQSVTMTAFSKIFSYYPTIIMTHPPQPDIQAVSHCGYVEEGKWPCGTKPGTGACIICLIKKYMFKSCPPLEVGNFIPYCISEEAPQNN